MNKLRVVFARDRAAPHQAAGRRGERLAARHLQRAGYRVLARNVRLGVGEVDLVCEAPDRRTIVVVEVKARVGTSDEAGERRPEANVTSHKQRKLRQLAQSLAHRPEFSGRPIRIDVIGVDLDARARRALAIRHHENAVTA